MFESIQHAPPDAILGLNEIFQRDARAEKVNLTVGVYKDESGITPILNCVKDAERRLLESESAKPYLGIAGFPSYNLAVRQLLLGEASGAIADGRAITVQTPGGTGRSTITKRLIPSLLISSAARYQTLRSGAVVRRGRTTTISLRLLDLKQRTMRTWTMTVPD